MLNYDKEGNLKRDIINYPVRHNDKTEAEIREAKKSSKKSNKIEKRTFYCLKCNTFHKYLYHGKPSKTYMNCLFMKKTIIDKEGKKRKIPDITKITVNFYNFLELMSNSEVFRIKFKKNWSQEKANYHKS